MFHFTLPHWPQHQEARITTSVRPEDSASSRSQPFPVDLLALHDPSSNRPDDPYGVAGFSPLERQFPAALVYIGKTAKT